MYSAGRIQERQLRKKTDAVDVHVGKRLKLRRGLLGLTQQQLAQAMGLTYQQVQKYENGIDKITASRLFRLSGCLEVPVSYFFADMAGVADSSPSMASSEGHNNFDEYEIVSRRDTLELISAFYAIGDAKLRTQIIEFVRAMARSSATGNGPGNR